MSTKRDSVFVTHNSSVFISSDSDKCQFSNFNLNKNKDCSKFVPLENPIKSQFNEKRNYLTLNDIRSEKSSSKLYFDSSKTYPWSNVADSDGEAKKHKMNQSSTNNGSTLSLHIAAYEDSIEAGTCDIIKDKEKPKILFDPIELPRQQEEEQANIEPEVMQFKASQKLLVPYQGDSTKILGRRKQRFTVSASFERMKRNEMNERKTQKISHPLSEDLPRVPTVEEGKRISDVKSAKEIYKIIELIGCGAQGKVFKVRRERDGKTFALKLGNNPAIFNEADILQKGMEKNFNHFVKYVDRGTYFHNDITYAFVVMELAGENLEKVISTYGKLSKATALIVAKQVLKALEDLHSIGMVHRDLKPDNLCIGVKEENDENDSQLSKIQIKDDMAAHHTLFLMDFGLAQSPFKTNVDVNQVGNWEFASLARSNLLEIAIKDDVESWGYLLLRLLNFADFSKGAEKLKRSIFERNEVNGVQLPSPIKAIFDHLKSVPLKAMPDYAAIREYLDQIFPASEIDLRLTWDAENYYHGPRFASVPHEQPAFFMVHTIAEKPCTTLYHREGSYIIFKRKEEANYEKLKTLIEYECSTRNCKGRIFVEKKPQAQTWKGVFVAGKFKDHKAGCKNESSNSLKAMTYEEALNY